MDRLVKIQYERPNGELHSAVIYESQVQDIKRYSNINILSVEIAESEKRDYLLKQVLFKK